MLPKVWLKLGKTYLEKSQNMSCITKKVPLGHFHGMVCFHVLKKSVFGHALTPIQFITIL
jgi:hypothetical protein